MKKLLLTSAGFLNPKIGEEFLKLVNKPASDIKLIFVTLARTKEELYYIGESKKELLDIGITNRNLKILNLGNKVLYDEVNGFDVIYVCGGNTFYLLYKFRETGFGEVIKKFIENGGVYVGVSAGSIIVGPNIEIASLGDKNDVGLKDLTGLSLVDVAISPHFNEEEHKAVEEFKKKVSYQVIPLTDNQALLILNSKTNIIGD
jgi:dipeptidase E